MQRQNEPITEGLATVLPIETNEVFYNPAQVFNRDLSILAISVFNRESQPGGFLAPKKPFLSPQPHVFEGLAASGLRSIRYVKELQFGAYSVTANDIESVAVERMLKNAAHNSISLNTTCADAILHLHANKGVYRVIDLDPYGSCAPFLDSAMAAVEPNGLLCITSTDSGVLCGNQPDLSFTRYGGFALKQNYQHEMGLRVMLHAVASAAARHRRGIRVLAAVSIDFYFRVFVQVTDSGAAALASMEETSIVFQCSQCEFHHVHAMGKLSGPSNRKPARFELNSSVCSQCDSQLSIGGPIWSGPLYDAAFVDSCISTIEDEQSAFPGITAWAKVKALMFGLKSELINVPLFYTIPGLMQAVKVSPPKLRVMLHFLRALGFKAGGSHRTPNAIKTDAPASVVFDLVRLYVQSLGTTAKTTLPQILAKPITTVIPDELEIDFNIKVDDDRSVPIYLPNPAAFWGPKPRASNKRPLDHIDQ